MKKYVSHKEVHAVQITGIAPIDSADDSTKLYLANSDTYKANHPMLSRYEPKIGDYLVAYKDGYMSISPRAAFEEGYTLAEKELS